MGEKVLVSVAKPAIKSFMATGSSRKGILLGGLSPWIDKNTL
jgi:hypothetical protein